MSDMQVRNGFLAQGGTFPLVFNWRSEAAVAGAYQLTPVPQARVSGPFLTWDRSGSQWNQVRDLVESWGHLPNNWDGRGGEAPSFKVLAYARDFLVEAQAAGAPVPDPAAAGDGEVSFRWRKADGFASVSFDQEGEVIVFIRAPGQIDHYGAEQPSSLSLEKNTVFGRLRAFV